MKFSLEVDCDNAAFEGDPGAELARILDELATVAVGMGPGDNGLVFDVNGNRVGRWNLEEE